MGRWGHGNAWAKFPASGPPWRETGGRNYEVHARSAGPLCRLAGHGRPGQPLIPPKEARSSGPHAVHGRHSALCKGRCQVAGAKGPCACCPLSLNLVPCPFPAQIRRNSRKGKKVQSRPSSRPTFPFLLSSPRPPNRRPPPFASLVDLNFYLLYRRLFFAVPYDPFFRPSRKTNSGCRPPAPFRP